jgi:hypothetical protein
METLQAVGRIKIERLAHPSYSPALSLGDFWVFGWAKTTLQNRIFADTDAMAEALIDAFASATFEQLQSVSQNCIERFEWVIRYNGESFIQ